LISIEFVRIDVSQEERELRVVQRGASSDSAAVSTALSDSTSSGDGVAQQGTAVVQGLILSPSQNSTEAESEALPSSNETLEQNVSGSALMPSS
jgi:hypothetical protein